MAKIDPDKLTGPQKAAIFLMLMGEEFTSQVYKYLDEDDIKRIGIEMAKIEYIPAEAVRKVLEEANIEAKEMLGDVTVSPEEFLKQSLIKAYGEKGKEIFEEIKKEIGPETFKKLKKLDPKTIASFLSNEHPQTIAIILVHLDSELSGQVLQFLPEKLRAEVLLRIALLNKVDPEIVKEISDALESELQSVGGALGKKIGGPEKAAEVLSHAGRELEDEILSEIEDENPALAEEIRKYLFTFEDFLNVDDFAIQTLLREISTDDLKLALKGASPEIREKFFRNMSKRAADLMKEELEMMGPVRISEVEKAQQNIIRVAKKLEQEGKIILSKGEEEFV
ncbi:MAG: Flagellar motor switch protein FliG [Thermodesulfobacterium sp. 37_54]|jgi:flagellar motor switch protein FliG|uniref:Flagellar motor switch protein FliG n=2 Tax=Thermodesulfobacterium commune TaxID=1741 RepID=A0A075WRE7_9BACT|nr:flagellar motor switch protein FliG [Thermodesulfobacterium commune]KUJ97257.1 MAG: Flagellar motor switch protein FliG [Thermodesulfobacterium sp. 37_54]AIH03441.1 flagellar motor switch protein FliG [Thermodesulfobacterium commune DSM 2178]KUK19077.1 MAG: Flagellar motor switch protein FliG [Thermodesulfobacterium commune]KUK37599.1 MAG: Flagellar motor switch protein FliG [Thermodesulfobacterium commune]HAA84419.1 flagellar motor switch protein FliG [Thermodesulfobacterium commune]